MNPVDAQFVAMLDQAKTMVKSIIADGREDALGRLMDVVDGLRQPDRFARITFYSSLTNTWHKDIVGLLTLAMSMIVQELDEEAEVQE